MINAVCLTRDPPQLGRKSGELLCIIMTQIEEIAQLLNALRARAHAILGNSQEAEDALQDVFVRAVNALPAFRSGAPLGPWLRRILENRCVDILRLRSRELPASFEDDRFDVGDASADPARILEQKERLRSVLRALGRLPKTYRDALLMHDFAGHDAHEIARVHRVPYNTIRTHVRRARERVRSMLGDTAA